MKYTQTCFDFKSFDDGKLICKIILTFRNTRNDF